MAQINIDDLKPNSFKSKEEAAVEETKTTPVITKNVVVKEKRVRSKLAEAFIGEDVGSVKDYIIFDVIIPAIKNTIVDGITNTVEMIFGVSPRKGKGRNKDYVSYASYYKPDRRDYRRNDFDDRNPRYDYRDLTFASRVDADEVLASLKDYVEDYGKASVADLYDFCGVTGTFQDHKYGWYDLKGVRVVRVKDGYEIDLPRVRPID